MKLIEIANTNFDEECNEITNYILNNCVPFLTQIDYDLQQYTLYRGAGNSSSLLNIIPGYRNKRKPKDTPLFAHNIINTVFKSKFGLPFRNGTFTSNRLEDVTAYGSKVYAVVPVGEFKFLWSNQINDLFDYLKQQVDKNFDDYVTIYDRDPEIIVFLRKLIKSPNFVNLYSNTNLKAAIRSKHEVMLYCDTCYYIDLQAYQVIIKKIAEKHS